MSAVVVKLVPMGDFPNRIREYRKAPKPGFPKGWTLEVLAEKIGCSQVQLSDLERGEVTLTQHWMRVIARALGIQPGDLLPETESSESLSPDERALIERYRIASPEQREQLSRVAEALVPWQPQGKKRAAG